MVVADGFTEQWRPPFVSFFDHYYCVKYLFTYQMSELTLTYQNKMLRKKARSLCAFTLKLPRYLFVKRAQLPRVLCHSLRLVKKFDN